MASNYTSNYQLCQWEGTDKVLRTDFNGDNAKIDAALKANADAIAAKAAQTDLEEVAEDLAAETTAREAADTALEAKVGLHLLQTATHDGTSVSLMSVPLTGINWSQWKRVHVLISVSLTGYSGIDVLLNKNNSYAIQEGTSGRLYLILFPLYGNVPTVCGLCPQFNRAQFSNGLAWAEAASLDIYRAASDTSLLAGSKVTIWGEP